MATAKRKTRKKTRAGWLVAAIAALLLAALIGYMAANASVVRVRRARVAVPDLPSAFEGNTLLYVSDIDLCGWNTPRKSAALMMRLQELRPDILLLGGDYTSPSVIESLNRPLNRAPSLDAKRARMDFFLLIKDFYAPLGKFAVAAPEDGDLDDLRGAAESGGVRLLHGDAAKLESDGGAIWLKGCADGERGAGSAFQRGDCVIAAAWSPDAFPLMLTSEAKDGGPWIDLLLSGHTHGGQISVLGRSILSLSTQERQFPGGWSLQNGVPVLVGSGVGCEGANLRLGSAPEVWLITLTAKPAEAE